MTGNGTVLEGLPNAILSAELERGSVSLELAEALYPLDAIYGAAFVFIDRFYVLLDRAGAGRFLVTLAPKSGVLEADRARAIAGEFANELLACAWRHAIAKENRAVIEAVTMKALAGAAGPPSLDELAAFDFTEEPLDDPLGIAVSWEEKYKGKKLDAAARPREEGEETGAK